MTAFVSDQTRLGGCQMSGGYGIHRSIANQLTAADGNQPITAMTEHEAYIALNLTPGLGPVTIRRLVEQTGSARAALSADRQAFRCCGIGSERASEIRSAFRLADPADEIEKAAQCGAVILTPDDPAYPAALHTIHDPPPALYVQGDANPLSRKGIALVGTRHPTVYGRDMAYRLGYQLAGSGCVVISGLARGIDTAAHRGALDAPGITVGVLGAAIDRFYPQENRDLARRMVEAGGIVLSEFAMGRRADRTTFPMRNRIVSALSAGVVVVEAPLRSGAMITADQALEQGRPVMAVPGRADTLTARGGHRLIRDGALLVESADDILEAISLLPSLSLPATACDRTAHQQSAEPAESGLGSDEKKLLQTLGQTEMDVDLLIRASGLPAGKVAALLISLEIKRRIQMLPGRQVRART